MAYCRLSLNESKHTLVDKPLTVREFCTTDGSQAQGIYGDFKRLSKLAAEKQALFMLCTQRRYQPAYREIAQRLVDVYNKTGNVVTFVQCMTSDGWWLNDKDEDENDGSGGIHSHRGFDPLQAGGGKLVKTGYHLLDIVPWLIRHVDISIKSAELCVNFQRPADLRGQPGPFTSKIPFATLPKNLRLPKGCVQAPGGEITIPFQYVPEVNATLQITMYDARKKPRCLIQIGLLHEGLSLRDSTGAKSRRTKIETMQLFQGPVGMVSLRRIGKITNGDLFGVGGKQHYELIMGKNPHHIGGGLPLEEFIIHYDERDTGPALEFLNTAFELVCNQKQWGFRQVTSPVLDHDVGIRLLSEAYKVAAKSFTSRSSPQPYRFHFESWARPPNMAEWIVIA